MKLHPNNTTLACTGGGGHFDIRNATASATSRLLDSSIRQHNYNKINVEEEVGRVDVCSKTFHQVDMGRRLDHGTLTARSHPSGTSKAMIVCSDSNIH